MCEIDKNNNLEFCQQVHKGNIKRIIDIDMDNCFETCPCQHYVKLELNDGTIDTILLFGNKIGEMCKKYKHKYDHIHFDDDNF
jgi:hypothetical protein